MVTNAPSATRPKTRERHRNAPRLTALGDPLGYVDGQNLYEYVGSGPTVATDPIGLERYVLTKDQKVVVIIQKGDTLWSIGKKLTGRGDAWKLFDPKTIPSGDPNRLRVGDRIPIPDEIRRAVDFKLPGGTLVPKPGQATRPAPPATAPATAPATGPATVPAAAQQRRTVSARGIRFIKRYEALGLKPYDDQTGKAITEWEKGATIGYGHLISKKDWERFKDGISKEDAEKLFAGDIQRFTQTVNGLVTAKVSQHQFDAIVSLAYNIGTGKRGFRGSSALKLINDPNAKTNYKDLQSAWKAWRTSQRKVMRGLVNRRADEWHLYSTGEYRR